ncbi:Rha family transcriptional regulator [Paenibacillus agaridevorans]|uniref:Rha family transcriptional regulator n=1 Tax=Paenibacillus agaridevorans TaxID=171404 RepID=UPI001BE4A3DE|nr:phage regulatory protein/antirepressor Ant [Paenibacillus agaridevorans]
MKLVFINNNRPVTDSLTVAEVFGKDHKNVLRDIEILDCSEEFSRLNFEQSTYINDRGREYPKVNMTQDGFTFLAFGYTGREAARFKEMYIGEFNRMRDELLQPQFQIPQTFTEALRLSLELAEKNETLQLENEELRSQTRYVDQILSSKGTVTITQIAKDYGLTGQALNKILHEEKIQYSVGGQWLLYQKHQDKGYTKSQTIDVHHTDGSITYRMNTKWTQKGRLFIHEALTKIGIVPYMDREHNKEA